jgi:hypothetical protein
MTLSPAAVATARRNAAHRIERFLAGLEHDGRLPNQHQRLHLREAFGEVDGRSISSRRRGDAEGGARFDQPRGAR